MAESEPQQFGEFAVIEKLGQGAMGAVYKARQTSLNRIVALKLLPAHYAADPDFLMRFKNEAMAAAALNHPHIVQVYAAGEDKGTHFFAMEYVEGESFGARMERKGRIDPREVIAVACHVAQALEYAWRKAKVIHRDIKPDNIFLSREGTVKVGDLGLAKLLGDPRGGVTQTGAAMGTPYYVSPEQAMAVREIDFRSDIYSLGCTIYHALTGEPPYRGKSAMAVMMQHISQPPPNIQTVWPACPPPIIGLLDRMLRKRPEERHESYAALLEELFQVAGRLDKPAPAEEAAHSLVVPKAVPRPPSTPDANRKSAPGAKGTEAMTVPPARGRGKLLAIFATIVAAVAAIALPVWQPWKKQTPVANGVAATTEKVPSPAPAPSVPTASIIPSAAKNPPSETPSATPAGSKPAPTTITATKSEPFMNSLDMKFVPVPGTQTLFCIWETRVRDYEAYAKANVVWDLWRRQEKDGRPVSRESDYPVVGVTWDEARAFCKWLTEKESAEGILPKGMKYRLPTDEEWSRAAGLAKEEGATPQDRNWKNELDFPWGTDFPPKAKVGNFADETFHKTFSQVSEKWVEGYDDNYATTSPVGVFARNEFGLHDMEGNVREWCEDAFDSGQSERVLRGASWSVGSRPYMLSSYRLHISPVSRGADLGFRCVLETGVTVPSAPTAAVQPSPPAPAPTPAPTAEKSDTVPDADGYLWLLGGNPYGAWKQAGNGGFILQDGVATSWVPQNGEGCWWYSKRTFGDFVLKLEFRIQTPGGNSGVYVRLPDPGYDMNVVRGQTYQIDISDSKNPMEMTGAICFVKAPTSVMQKAGEWNELEIYAFGQRYMVKLNGALVNDFTGTRGLSGYIGLQDYSVGGVQFRNVRIKTLSSPAELPKPTGETEKWLEQVDAIYQPLYKRDVTAPFQSGMADLKKSYLTALTRESTGAKGATKLKDAIACRNERQRIEDGGSVPADDSDQPPAVLKSLRAAYRTQSARLEIDRRKHATTVFTQYDKVLATNQAALTQRQRLDEALLLQQRRDALAMDWGITPPAGSAAAATISQPFVNTLGMKFVPVPILGGPTGGRRVLFSIWDTRVQDYAVYAAESTGVNMDWKDAQSEGVKQGPTHPVVNVSWVDAKAFCAWLTRKERAAGKLGPSDEYRLPGDYEWSCAVGIGDREDPRMLPSVKDAQIRGVYPWGTAWPPPKDAANVLSANGYKFTSPVGSFAVNKNGLYDMGGNVWQWCEDWYDVKQQGRVLRGGAWNTFAPPVNLLASYRTLLTPGYRGGTYGFRCVLDIGSPTK